ncbi:MAG: methionine adenosyltransferase [Bacteroidales bacterium]|nr:methionine adenosyltransferase [Bacteroidales bacterium]
MSYLLTSESVSEGHPDKVADQISDALLDEFLKRDKYSKVACETLVTTGLVVCAGEVKTDAYVDVQSTARNVIKEIGYTKGEYMFESNSCGVISAIHEQSPDINRGVDRKAEKDMGAGDQGMMFGYACTDMDNYMPYTIELSNRFIAEITRVRKEKRRMKYLRPDAKVQVTIEFSDKGKPIGIDTLVFSVQHDEFLGDDEAMRKVIEADIKDIIIPAVRRKLPAHVKRLFNTDYKLYVNPTGKFVIGGPHGDTGLTGRKIIVDSYGGMCPHGGGAFSGKDPSKVDRSGSYAARHIAKNIVAAGIAKECMVQVSYAIGVAEPVNIFIDTKGSTKIKDKNGKTVLNSDIAQAVASLFDLTPYGIIERFGLTNPIYFTTAARKHFGIAPYIGEVEVYYKDKETYARQIDGQEHLFKKVCFYPWEKLDYVDKLRKYFNMDE